MLAVKIENKKIENRLLEYVKTQHKTVEDVVIEALEILINMEQKKVLEYKIKDPGQHIHKIEHKYDNDLCDEVALTHIKNSAEYIHDLRRNRNT